MCPTQIIYCMKINLVIIDSAVIAQILFRQKTIHRKLLCLLVRKNI